MTTQPIAAQYPDLYTLTRAGQVFSAETAATGVAPGAAFGTTAPFALYNPVGSGVNLVILKAMLGYVSGTLGAGFMAFVVNTNPAAAAVTGTAIVPVNHLLNGAASQAQPKTTATLPAAPTALRPFCCLDASLASSVVGVRKVEEDVAGAIIVPPGCTLSLESTAAAGTEPLVVLGMTWAEVPTTVA